MMTAPHDRDAAAVPPPGGARGVSLKLWIVLTRAHEAVARQAAADVARHGLTIAEFAVLETLYHKGPVLLGELQKRALVSSGGTTFLVDRLAEKGLVERRSCETDRRARYVALMPEGAALIARIFPVHAARIAEAMSGLTQREQKAVTALLKRLGLAAAALPERADSASEPAPARGASRASAPVRRSAPRPAKRTTARR